MNHQFQFARSITPRVAAKAADARPSLLPASAATSIVDDQTKTRHRAGQPVRGCDASMPAHHGQGRAHLRSAGSCFFGASVSLHDDLLPETGRGFGLGIFSADGRGCSPAIAINIKSTRCGHFECVSQRLPSHFMNSLRYGPEPKRTGGQTIGNFIQGRD